MTLKLKTDEPCDIYIIGDSESQNVTAVVCESKNVYKQLLQTGEPTEDFTLVCSKHSFPHQALAITLVDDFALIDGAACYKASIPSHVKEVL